MKGGRIMKTISNNMSVGLTKFGDFARAQKVCIKVDEDINKKFSEFCWFNGSFFLVCCTLYIVNKEDQIDRSDPTLVDQ